MADVARGGLTLRNAHVRTQAQKLRFEPPARCRSPQRLLCKNSQLALRHAPRRCHEALGPAQMPPRVGALDAAALIAHLQEHRHNPDVQTQCLASLCDSVQLSAESALTLLPVVVAALRAHPGAAALQTSGCGALMAIAHAADEELVSAGAAAVDAIRAVVGAMKTHPDVAGLQVACCCALEVMSVDDRLREAAFAAGAIHAVAAALRAHVLCADVAYVCAALAQLTAEHPRAMAQAGAAGAVAAAVAVLRAHPSSEGVQNKGCLALSSLVAFEAKNQARAIQAGAVEAILLALRTHAADVTVQIHGCRALGRIAQRHTAVIAARSGRLLSDILAADLAALNAHRADAGVQWQACSSLMHLFDTDAHRAEAGRAGAVTALVAALRAHPAAALVQETGCDAMGHLCAENSANAVQACGSGALQAIVAGMRAHPANTNVQLAGCGALNCIVEAHPRLQAAVGAGGAVEAIVDAMQVPSEDAAEDLPRISCDSLSNVTRGHRGNAERACAAGGMQALAAVMGARRAHDETDAAPYSIYNYALRALDALLGGNDDAALRAVHAGVADIVAREGTRRVDSSVRATHARVLSALEAAAQRHDAGACAHDGCTRCGAARDSGHVCALAGCGARKRADGSGKRLHRCGACAVAAYCGPAHQREHWERHKAECAALRAAACDDEAAGETQTDA
jgi:hypothetical protein